MFFIHNLVLLILFIFSFVGTILANIHAHRSLIEDDDIMCRIICNAQRAAVLTLKSNKAVSTEIKPFLLTI